MFYIAIQLYRRRHEEEPAWLAQLTGLLKPLLEREEERRSLRKKGNDRDAETPASTSVTVVEPDVRSRESGR